MNDIFTPYTHFTLIYIIVYIDDVLIFSQSINQHFKHLETFLQIVKNNRLVMLATKLKSFQTKIRFLIHKIHKNTIQPINKSIEFAS